MRRCCRIELRERYALLGYDGTLLLKGVAFRSSRSEPFGEAFLRSAIKHVLVGDVAGVRERYLRTVELVRRRIFTTYEVSSRVRLTKSPAAYAGTRPQRRELPYDSDVARRQPERTGERATRMCASTIASLTARQASARASANGAVVG